MAQNGEQRQQQQQQDRDRKRAAARKKREQELRRRRIILGALLAIALLCIVMMAVRLQRRNAGREESAASAVTGTGSAAQAAAESVTEAAAEEESGLEAYRKMKEEEAAAEASRKAAEEAAAEEQARKIEEEKKAAEEAMREQEKKEQEEAAAKAAEEKAVEEGRIPGLNESYDFKATEDTEEITDEAIESPYVILVDLKKGTVVAGKEYDERLNPASMTKILTLLVAVENMDVSKIDTDTYTINHEILEYVYGNGMSAVGWTEGDEPTIRSLLYGTILPSGADAALALAEYVAGSEEEFVKLMNKKLKELGIDDTAHFTNVVGAYDEDHYCTAMDMATIMRAAIDNELCRDVLSKHSYIVPDTESDELPDGIEISNWFLRRIEDKDTHGEVVCAKTGYVNESGSCAASYQVSNDGGQYICVTVGASGPWPCIYDHVEIYDTYTE